MVRDYIPINPKEDSPLSQRVWDHLRKVLDGTIKDSSLDGAHVPGTFKLPCSSLNGRVLTWEKIFRRFVGLLPGVPRNRLQNGAIIDDSSCGLRDICWLVRAGPGGYSKISFGYQGCKSVPLHQLMWTAVNGNQTTYNPISCVCSHICGNGYSPMGHTPVCVNPYHVVVESQRMNIQRKTCKVDSCIHNPQCRKQDPFTGVPK